MFGLGGAPCPIRFQMVVSYFLTPILWKNQKNWGLCNIADLVDDAGVYLTLIVFNIKFQYTLSYDLDHSSIEIYHPIVDGFEGSYEVMYADGNAIGGMILNSNE